jgi:hypothetical protein
VLDEGSGNAEDRPRPADVNANLFEVYAAADVSPAAPPARKSPGERALARLRALGEVAVVLAMSVANLVRPRRHRLPASGARSASPWQRRLAVAAVGGAAVAVAIAAIGSLGGSDARPALNRAREESKDERIVAHSEAFTGVTDTQMNEGSATTSARRRTGTRSKPERLRRHRPAGRAKRPTKRPAASAPAPAKTSSPPSRAAPGATPAVQPEPVTPVPAEPAPATHKSPAASGPLADEFGFER